jgi:hypothetical protein
MPIISSNLPRRIRGQEVKNVPIKYALGFEDAKNERKDLQVMHTHGGKDQPLYPTCY